MGRMVTLADYAEYYGVDAANVRQKILRGTLKAEKKGGSWRIDIDQPYKVETVPFTRNALKILQTYSEIMELIIRKYNEGVVPIETWENYFPVDNCSDKEKKLAESLIQNIRNYIKALAR